MKKAILFIMAVFAMISCGHGIDKEDLKEGDVVFISGQTSQAPYIKLGTMSKWSHCGVIVQTSDGLQVLEASKTVRLTPYDKFISWAKDDNYKVKRPKKQLDKPINYKKYLGMPYDVQFKFDNGKMYCSELVWLIYKDQGIELCKPRTVSSFICSRIPKVKKQMDLRGISMEQQAVAPVDLYRAI